jgi:hypothetical protein
MKKILLAALCLLVSNSIFANTCTRADLNGSYVSVFSSFGGQEAKCMIYMTSASNSLHSSSYCKVRVYQTNGSLVFVNKSITGSLNISSACAITGKISTPIYSGATAVADGYFSFDKKTANVSLFYPGTAGQLLMLKQ